MVGIHQAGAGRYNSVPVGIQVIAEGDVELFFESDQPGHGVRG